MNMNISTHMAAFIETHGGLDLGEFYKWFKGDSPEEIIHTYNSMLLAKYNKEMRGKLEKFDVEKEVSSIKEQLESLPSGESLHETIGGLSQVEKDVCSIKEQLKSLPSLPNLQTVVGGLSLVEESYTELVGGLSRVDDDVSSIKEQLETLPSLPDLQTIGGVLSLVKNDVFSIKAQLKSLPSLPNLQTVVGGLSRVEEDVSSIKEQLKSIPSVETLQSTVMECISLKDIVECMCKTIDVLMNENRRISSLIDKPSTVSDHQGEWAALTVCYNDLRNFIEKEWAGKQLKIGHIKYDCRQHGYGEEAVFSVHMEEPLNTRDGPVELSMDEFLLSIERLFKINIPSIYDDVHLELRIKNVSVRTGTQPFLEIPTRTVGEWLKEIREFPGKLRANPDSYFLIKRKEIIPPVIFNIIIFMVGGLCYSLQQDLLQAASWADHKKGHLVAEANKCKLAWQRELVK
jgi:hypothetical protein